MPTVNSAARWCVLASASPKQDTIASQIVLPESQLEKSADAADELRRPTRLHVTSRRSATIRKGRRVIGLTPLRVMWCSATPPRWGSKASSQSAGLALQVGTFADLAKISGIQEEACLKRSTEHRTTAAHKSEPIVASRVLSRQDLDPCCLRK